MAVKADRKKNAKQFNPQLLVFYQARRRRELQAKHNAKDDSRPKAKAAYHRWNELEEGSDEEEIDEENDESFDNVHDSDSDNDNVNGREMKQRAHDIRNISLLLINLYAKSPKHYLI